MKSLVVLNKNKFNNRVDLCNPNLPHEINFDYFHQKYTYCLCFAEISGRLQVPECGTRRLVVYTRKRMCACLAIIQFLTNVI